MSKDEVMQLAETWIGLEGFVLGEMTQKQSKIGSIK